MSHAVKSSSKSNTSNTSKSQRCRSFGTVVYPDSAPDGWLDVLKELHIPCFVSPLHDKDVNADGNPKKAHYHVLLMFDGPKDFDSQVKPIFESIGAVGRERVASTRGYARYLCHLDNPEKAQYRPSDVICMNGADYTEIARSDAQRTELEDEIYDGIEGVIFHMLPFDFPSLSKFCRVYRPDWLSFLRRKGAFYFYSLIKSSRYTDEYLNSTTGGMDYAPVNVWEIIDGKLMDKNRFFEVRPYWEDEGFDFEKQDFEARRRRKEVERKMSEKALNPTDEKSPF